MPSTLRRPTAYGLRSATAAIRPSISGRTTPFAGSKTAGGKHCRAPTHGTPGDARQTKEYAYGFTARLAPRIYPSVYARYRICKNVYMENPRRDYLLTADFTVTPFVPFTRFPEQTGDNN